GAEVVRDRVEAAAVDEAGAARLPRRVVLQEHTGDELGVARGGGGGGGRGGAGGDQRRAVERVRADGGDDDLGRLGDPGERGRVGGIGLEQRRRRDGGTGGGEAPGDGLELAPVAADHRPAQPRGRVGSEVV